MAPARAHGVSSRDRCAWQSGMKKKHSSSVGVMTMMVVVFIFIAKTANPPKSSVAACGNYRRTHKVTARARECLRPCDEELLWGAHIAGHSGLSTRCTRLLAHLRHKESTTLCATAKAQTYKWLIFSHCMRKSFRHWQHIKTDFFKRCIVRVFVVVDQYERTPLKQLK